MGSPCLPVSCVAVCCCSHPLCASCPAPRDLSLQPASGLINAAGLQVKRELTAMCNDSRGIGATDVGIPKARQKVTLDVKMW